MSSPMIVVFRLFNGEEFEYFGRHEDAVERAHEISDLWETDIEVESVAFDCSNEGFLASLNGRPIQLKL